MLMADVYRSEVVFKSDAKTIKNFLNKCFSLIDDKYYLDFEKFIPLNGKNPLGVWDCGALAHNFEFVKNIPESEIVVRFDTVNGGAGFIINELLTAFPNATIQTTLICEMLDFAIVITRPSFHSKPKIRDAHKGMCSLSDEAWINDIGRELWGYSKAPDLEKQGFIPVGNGQFMKIHEGVDAFKNLYPRFKAD